MTEKTCGEHSRIIKLRFGVLVLMVLAAAFSRLIPYPPDFAAIMVSGLFGAAYFTRKWIAIILPLTPVRFELVKINFLYWN